MSAIRWAALPVIAGVLSGPVAVAAADEPAPTPTPTPTTTPSPSATPSPTPTPTTNTAGESIVYITTITTTVTTTIVNAPITVIAAPVTTTINHPTNGSGHHDAGRARRRVVLNLSGCGQAPLSAAAPRRGQARVRLARNAVLLVRVNGKQVTAVRPPSAEAGDHSRRVPLRLRVAPNGILTIRRPSGHVMSVRGCTPV
jgi:cytoskeletal protein RodZ